jgi:hypothetical protein
LQVTTNVPGARLWIDGVPTRSVPGSPIWLNPGVHRVLVAKDGRLPALESPVLLPGERRRLEMPLPLEQPLPPAAPPAAEPIERTPLWISMGAAGATAALGIAFAVLTRSADARFERELRRYPADEEALDSARSRVATLAAVTDVCLGVSAVAAGLSLYFGVSSAAADGAPIGNAVSAAPAGSGVSFQGRF